MFFDFVSFYGLWLVDAASLMNWFMKSDDLPSTVSAKWFYVKIKLFFLILLISFLKVNLGLMCAC